jgi:hypothetical protein
MSELYEDDLHGWTRQQAELLRQRADGRLVNDAAIDWHNLAEEILEVGDNAYEVVLGQWLTAMEHLLLVRAWPHSLSVLHWLTEADEAFDIAARRHGPSMNQKLEADLPKLYARARRRLRRKPTILDGQTALLLPEDCPWSIADLLANPAAAELQARGEP